MKGNEKRSAQAMGLFLSPEWLHDFADMETAIRAAAESHFGIIIGFARHMHHTLTSPKVHAAVSAAAEISHRHGLKFVMDMDWAHWGQEIAENDPGLAMWHIVAAESLCNAGAFDCRIPSADGRGQEVVAEISAAYGLAADGTAVRLAAKDYVLNQDSFTSMMPMPALVDEQETGEHRRPGPQRYSLRLSGRLKGGQQYKSVRIYVAIRSYRHPDVAHPGYLKAQSDLLDMYRDIPLDGVGWDEPGKGGSLKGYKAGLGFLEFFREQCGYDLRIRLLELDRGMDAVALQTRRDYYQTLNAMNGRAQDAFNRKAKACFGDDLFLGTHHTYSGMATDLRCGCSDYFRLGKTLSQAFTDTGWDISPHAETVYSYVLADSLRKELGKPLSYVNDWSMTPHVAWYDYHTRLKMLYRIEWFAIFLGRYAEGFPTFPWDRHWPDVGRNAGQLEAFGHFAGGGKEPQSETAVWFSWEGPAYLDSTRLHYIRMWMTCNFNLSEESLKRGRFFDYVSTAAIEGGRVAEGAITLPGGTYRQLVLPYAAILTEKMWAKIRECVSARVDVVFVGPPPFRLLDNGRDISDEFCEWCGIEATGFEQYDAWFRAHKPTPSFTDWEPEKIDFCFPVTPKTGVEQLLNDSNEAIGVRNTAGITWVTALDPREQFFRHISRPQAQKPDHYGRGYYRLLTGDDPEEFILVCVAPLHESLHENFAFGGLSLKVTGGRWAALKIANGKLVGKLADDQTKIAS